MGSVLQGKLGQTRTRTRIEANRRHVVHGLWVVAAFLLLCMGCRGTDLLDRLDGAVLEHHGAERIRRTSLTIAEQRRAALVAPAPATVRFEDLRIEHGDVLRFGFGVDPSAWKLGGDGVVFRVYGERQGARKLLFSRYIDPKRRAEERRWFDEVVSLDELFTEPDEGETRVALVFTTGEGMRSDGRADRAAWSDLRIERPWRELGREANPPNVLLISIDTLRADHMGVYGYPRPTTPHIDAWARTGIVFTQAWAPSHHTLVSHMSLFTSQYPDVHRILAWNRSAKGVALDERGVTLAEMLHSAGYSTAAFVRSCYWLDARFGFAQGFDSYRARGGDAALMNRAAVFPWLHKHRDERFFLFVHYYDVHSDWRNLPYASPPGFRSKFTSDYHGSFTGCGDGVCATRYLMKLDREGKQLDAADLDYIRGLYDGGVAFTDQQVGALLDELKALGLYDRTLVALIADHGEAFREHGRFIHSQLYREITHVPFILSGPKPFAGPRRIDEPVQILDLMPTILDVLGIPPVPEIQGRSLLPLMEGGAGPTAPIFMTGRRGFGVVEGQWKLIFRPGVSRGELYDLAADANERRDLMATHPVVARRLMETLKSWRAENARKRERLAKDARAKRPRHVRPSAADLERLRNLGYAD